MIKNGRIVLLQNLYFLETGWLEQKDSAQSSTGAEASPRMDDAAVGMRLTFL